MYALEKYNCRPDKEYKTDNPKIIPYFCPNNHHITNLTKNTFATRIRQGLGPCAVCSVINRKKARILHIKETIEKAGGIFISLEKRKVEYNCKCGKYCQTWIIIF